MFRVPENNAKSSTSEPPPFARRSPRLLALPSKIQERSVSVPFKHEVSPTPSLTPSHIPVLQCVKEDETSSKKSGQKTNPQIIVSSNVLDKKMSSNTKLTSSHRRKDIAPDDLSTIIENSKIEDVSIPFISQNDTIQKTDHIMQSSESVSDIIQPISSDELAKSVSVISEAIDCKPSSLHRESCLSEEKEDNIDMTQLENSEMATDIEAATVRRSSIPTKHLDKTVVKKRRIISGTSGNQSSDLVKELNEINESTLASSDTRLNINHRRQTRYQADLIKKKDELQVSGEPHLIEDNETHQLKEEEENTESESLSFIENTTDLIPNELKSSSNDILPGIPDPQTDNIVDLPKNNEDNMITASLESDIQDSIGTTSISPPPISYTVSLFRHLPEGLPKKPPTIVLNEWTHGQLVWWNRFLANRKRSQGSMIGNFLGRVVDLESEWFPNRDLTPTRNHLKSVAASMGRRTLFVQSLGEMRYMTIPPRSVVALYSNLDDNDDLLQGLKLYGTPAALRGLRRTEMIQDIRNSLGGEDNSLLEMEFLYLCLEADELDSSCTLEEVRYLKSISVWDILKTRDLKGESVILPEESDSLDSHPPLKLTHSATLQSPLLNSGRIGTSSLLLRSTSPKKIIHSSTASHFESSPHRSSQPHQSETRSKRRVTYSPHMSSSSSSLVRETYHHKNKGLRHHKENEIEGTGTLRQLYHRRDKMNYSQQDVNYSVHHSQNPMKKTVYSSNRHSNQSKRKNRKIHEDPDDHTWKDSNTSHNELTNDQQDDLLSESFQLTTTTTPPTTTTTTTRGRRTRRGRTLHYTDTHYSTTRPKRFTSSHTFPHQSLNGSSGLLTLLNNLCLTYSDLKFLLRGIPMTLLASRTGIPLPEELPDYSLKILERVYYIHQCYKDGTTYPIHHTSSSASAAIARIASLHLAIANTFLHKLFRTIIVRICLNHQGEQQSIGFKSENFSDSIQIHPDSGSTSLIDSTVVNHDDKVNVNDKTMLQAVNMSSSNSIMTSNSILSSTLHPMDLPVDTIVTDIVDANSIQDTHLIHSHEAKQSLTITDVSHYHHHICRLIFSLDHCHQGIDTTEHVYSMMSPISCVPAPFFHITPTLHQDLNDHPEETTFSTTEEASLLQDSISISQMESDHQTPPLFHHKNVTLDNTINTSSVLHTHYKNETEDFVIKEHTVLNPSSASSIPTIMGPTTVLPTTVPMKVHCYQATLRMIGTGIGEKKDGSLGGLYRIELNQLLDEKPTSEELQETLQFIMAQKHYRIHFSDLEKRFEELNTLREIAAYMNSIYEDQMSQRALSNGDLSIEDCKYFESLWLDLHRKMK